MSVDPRLVEMIAVFEGFRPEAYRDQAGVWTIGYGHTKGVAAGDRISHEAAREMLEQEIAEFRAAVEKAVSAPALPHEIDAFTSLAFNIGATAFAGSTALKRFNAGDREGAADALLWWDKITDPTTGKKRVSNGLRRRRQMERSLFLTGWAPVGEAPRESLARSRTVAGGTVAIIGAALSGAADAARQIEPYIGLHPWLKYGFVGLTMAGAAYVLYARVDDWRKGRR